MKKINSALLFVICFLISGFPVAAQTLSDTAVLPVDPTVKTGQLANGLTYYISRNALPEKKVELRLVLNVGSNQEDNFEQGFAHYCEHMAFRGTLHFPKTALIAYLQSIGMQFGADLNARTGWDETIYILPIPLDKPDNLDSGFQILEDWAHNVSYEDEDIRKERGVIEEEYRLSGGSDNEFFIRLAPKLYPHTKYYRLPIGDAGVLQTFSNKDLRDFYRTWYRPDLMAVVVVGDIDPALAESLLIRHFSTLRNPPKEKTLVFPDIPLRETTEAAVISSKYAADTRVEIHYPLVKKVPIHLVKDYRQELVRDLFIDMLKERLQGMSGQGTPPFVYPTAEFSALARGYEGFDLSAQAVNNEADTALTALIGAMESLKRYGFTKSELDRARKEELASRENDFLERDKTESSYYVDQYIQNFLSKAPIPGRAAEYAISQALLSGIGLEDVNGMTRLITSNENRLFLVLGPDKKGIELPSRKQVLAIANDATRQKIGSYEEKVMAGGLMREKPVSGSILHEEQNDSLGTVELVLSNQIRVTLKKTDFRNDEVKLYASRLGGTGSYGPEDRANKTFAMEVIARMGIGDHSPTDLAKINAGKKAELDTRFDLNWDIITGSSSAKDLETLLQMLYLTVTQPRRDEQVFNAYRKSRRSAFVGLTDIPDYAFADTVSRLLFQNNPLRPILFPKPSDIDSLNLDRVMAIYKERLGEMSGMHFTIAGNFDEHTIRQLIQTYIAGLPVAAKRPPFVDNGLRYLQGKQDLNIFLGKEKNSEIRLEYNGELPYSEDLAFRLEALEEVINIRLLEELREKMSAVYEGVITGGLWKYPFNNYGFEIHLSCAPKHVDALLQGIDAVITNIIANGPDPKDLEKVKQHFRKKHLADVRTNDYWVKRLDGFASGDEDPHRMIHYLDYVDALSVKDLQNGAVSVFSGKNVLRAVLYPKSWAK